MLNPKVIGAIVGLVVGIVVLCFGILKAILLAVFILIGWLVGKFWMGELDIPLFYERFMNRRGRKPRR